MNKKSYFAIGVCTFIAIINYSIGGLQNVIGAPMIGLFIGMLIVNILPSVDKDFKKGTTFAGKKCFKHWYYPCWCYFKFHTNSWLWCKSTSINYF